MKIALGIVFLFAGGSVAACDATFNFSQLPYSAVSNADAGFGSTEAERQAAVYAGVAIYNAIPSKPI